MWHATEPSSFPTFEALTGQPVPPVRSDQVAARSREEAFEAEVKVFAEAMQAYKQSSGRMFPTWCETLEVLRSLGYEKTS